MHKQLELQVDTVTLKGDMVFPDDAQGLIIFSHGSGSSRFSPRNNFVAQQLQRRGMATFLFDLLTKEEDEDYTQRFNIELLSNRLVHVTRQIVKVPECHHLPIGYFGASTGAASALSAAAILKREISAVVSRGGRPDLAKDQLPQVIAPTLLIVGGLDEVVIKLNKVALTKLKGIKHLQIIEGATHLFEEPGTLEQVAELSSDWFVKHLSVKNLVH